VDEQVVVVTGATAGLGRAVARQFASGGARVALLARGLDGLEATASELSGAGAKVLALPVDVADFDGMREAAQRIEHELGAIDVWVNNAMTSVFAPFVDIDMVDFERATAVDYLGFVYGTKVALEHMLPRDRGVIVQVSSALAYRGIPLQSAYCGSKHAILGFTESLRTELFHDHSDVRVTMVHMPAMNTPQFGWVRSVLPRRAQPVPPIYQPEVGARVVCFAADHPERRSYYVGGSTVLTVLGNMVAPGLLDRYLGRTGFDAQQTGQPEEPGRADNLHHPVSGDHGAHGTFDARAHDRSPQVWLSTHRPGAATIVAGLGGLVGHALVRRRRRRRATGPRRR
jgi:NAD(P)-dependent dehydrogenase (short-subunit alcohol dehydrogenase family)